MKSGIKVEILTHSSEVHSPNAYICNVYLRYYQHVEDYIHIHSHININILYK